MSSDGKNPEIEVLVIGAGVVGLAIARKLAATGKNVVVCEQHDHFGSETSSRNSEVIHAGIYYPPGSLKAELCVAGRKALYRYCEDRDVPFRKCGKLIVAGDETELRLLGEMGRNAAMVGTPTRMIGIAEVAEREPLVRCVGALESPETGIVDSHALMVQMIADLEHAGGMVAYANAVQRVTRKGPNWEVELSGGRVTAGWVVNAAGLHASRVAKCVTAIAPGRIPETRFARGLYARAIPAPKFQHLIYPVPQPGGLGIHATLDLAGSVRFGPDVEWIDEIDYTADKTRLHSFRSAVARYWPEASQSEFTVDYTGIRPKLSQPGAAAADFKICGPVQMGLPNQVHLFGIESPGLTASLAIADYVSQMVLQE